MKYPLVLLNIYIIILLITCYYKNGINNPTKIQWNQKLRSHLLYELIITDTIYDIRV